ncbi:hypothetical protein [Sphingobium indicum]
MNVANGRLQGDESAYYSHARPLNRRIMFDRETVPSAADFSQTVDVDLDLGDGETRPLPNMPGYLIRSVSEAISYTRSLLAIGVTSVTYRLGGGLRPADATGYVYAPLLINTSAAGASLDNSGALIARHAEFYRSLRAQFPTQLLFIIADPFGLAPNLSDGAWGARDADGKLDPDATGRLLATIAVEYAQAGADAILTMGRIEGEIEISRQALASAGLTAQLYAFSQNNESKAAYVYLEKLGKADSFQKILPGNITEMKIRTILDVAAGADAIIVKPADNLHVVQFTIDFLESPHVALSFLRDTLGSDIYKDRHDIREEVERVLAGEESFIDNARRVRVGTYTVSGTYYSDSLLERAKGPSFLFSVQDERFRNILSILKDRATFIIDRSAEWYLRQLDASNSGPAETARLASTQPPTIHIDVV